jgi:hypothetical protein
MGRRKKGTHSVETSLHTLVLFSLTSYGIAFNATSRVTNCDKDSAEVGRFGSGKGRWDAGEVGDPDAGVEFLCKRDIWNSFGTWQETREEYARIGCRLVEGHRGRQWRAYRSWKMLEREREENDNDNKPREPTVGRLQRWELKG